MNSESQPNQIKTVTKREYSKARRRVFRLKALLMIPVALSLLTIVAAIYNLIVEKPLQSRQHYSMLAFLVCLWSAELLLPLFLFAFLLKRRTREAQIELSLIEVIDQESNRLSDDQILVRASARADDELLREGSGVAQESREQMLRAGSAPNEES